MKKLKKILIAIVILLALLVAFVFYSINSAKNLTEYDLGSDKIPSINAIIGAERKVTKVGSGVSTESGNYKEYTYESSSTAKDLLAYATHLFSNGWLATKDPDLNTEKGELQLAAESGDKGKILVMTIAFEPDKYTIHIRKFDGTLTRR